MTPFLQVLNIGTLAAWLTLSGASTVACWVKMDYLLPERKVIDLRMTDEGNIDIDQESAGSAAADVTDAPPESEPSPEPTPVAPIPDAPEVPEIQPLPEIPDIPQPSPESLQVERPKEAPRPKVAKASKSNGPPNNRTRPAASSNNSGGGSGSGAGTNAGTGAGAVGADRFAGGRRPKPDYPADCRARGEQGRVGFVLTVDEQGNVVDVRIKSPCPYAGLNNATANGVRRWKFKPGPRGSIQASVTFNIQDTH